MPSNFDNLVITWFDATDNYVTSASIKEDVMGLPIFTDSGSGTINSCTITVKAPYGRRITTLSPVSIDEFDRFLIFLDDIAGNTYNRYFEIQTIIPGTDKDGGTILQLECLGIEYHTQMMHFSRQFWFASASLPSRIIGDTYNDNKGSTQPLLAGHDVTYDPDTAIGNDLPIFTQAIIDYGISPAYMYDLWMDLVDRQGAAAAGGGVFDFFEAGFDTPSVNSINMRIFASGSTPESKTTNNTPVTIESTLEINPAEAEGDLENRTGTISYVMGDPRSGSLQFGREKYNSQIFQFTFRPQWSSTITYGVFAKVQYLGQHYVSLQNNNINNTPPGPTSCTPDADSFWNQMDMSTQFGDFFQYSEWTDDKAAVILNGMAAPDQVSGPISGVFTSTGASAFDGNIIINANGFFRTMVDDRASSVAPAKGLETEFLYANGLFPRGYRFLNVGDGVFSPGEKDFKGVLFKNSVVEFQTNPDPNSEQVLAFVKYTLDSSNDKLQIASIFESKVWQWNSGPETFTDITTSDLGGDCFHQFFTIKNSTSFDPKPTETDCAKFPEVTMDGTPFDTNVDSSVEIVYDFNSVISDRITDQTAYRSHGAWFNLRFPYPVSTFNGITEGVGDIYGGGINSITDDTNEPATLDISNMGYTPSGKLGYNQSDSTRLSKLVTFSFALGLKIEGRNPFSGDLYTLDGTANMRVQMGDTNDNVWSFDFEMPYTDGTKIPIDTQISAYNVVRNNKPRYFKLNNLIDLLNPKEIDNQNIFEQRNIKWIVIQHQDQYDEFGRFAPEGTLDDLSNTSLSASLGGRITMTIDDLHFKKALVVNTGANSIRNLEPEMIHRQDIMLFDQANEVALSQNQIEQFPHKEFDVKTTGDKIFDIRFGDSFYYKSTRLVIQSDKPVSDLDEWSSGVLYKKENDVKIGTNGYRALKEHTSSGGNQPPNAEFWSTAFTGTVPNTIKLVAKNIEYSLSRPPAGRGGVQRNIQGAKRLT